MAVNRAKKDMLTTTDVANLLNLHANTVRRWSDNGILKAYRIGSRDDRRFKYEDIMSILKKSATNNLTGRTDDEGGENDRRC